MEYRGCHSLGDRRSWAILGRRISVELLPFGPSALPRRFELLIARPPDRLGATGQHVGRGDEADRAVQALVIVIRDEALDHTPCGLEGVGRLRTDRPDALSDAVDSPLGPEEIKQILQLLTVAFSTGSAAVEFYKHLRDLLGSEKVLLKEGRTGRDIAHVDQHSSPADLASRSTGQ